MLDHSYLVSTVQLLLLMDMSKPDNNVHDLSDAIAVCGFHYKVSQVSFIFGVGYHFSYHTISVGSNVPERSNIFLQKGIEVLLPIRDLSMYYSNLIIDDISTPQLEAPPLWQQILRSILIRPRKLISPRIFIIFGVCGTLYRRRSHWWRRSQFKECW